jgi:DNA repair photolyase
MPELAIYKPKGKAAEYSEYACNFYVGCSGNCSYCYLKKGRGYKILGGNKPRLKACFKDEEHAMRIFAKELDYNISELRKSGIFFSFTCDPLSNETKELTYQAIELCNKFKVYANILTKQIDFEFDHMDENYTSIGLH